MNILKRIAAIEAQLNGTAAAPGLVSVVDDATSDLCDIRNDLHNVKKLAASNAEDCVDLHLENEQQNEHILENEENIETLAESAADLLTEVDKLKSNPHSQGTRKSTKPAPAPYHGDDLFDVLLTLMVEHGARHIIGAIVEGMDMDDSDVSDSAMADRKLAALIRKALRRTS